METRPPALIEEIVRRLTPPVSREHVLGDLSERYVSPESYVLDAIQTIPFVVASRLRRVIEPGLFLIGVLFIWGCVFWSVAQNSWMAGIIPTAVCSVALALRDAYRTLTPKPWLAVTVDMVCFVAAAVASQGVLALFAPQWMLSRELPISGYVIGLVILFLMRLQLPSGFFTPKPLASSISMSELTAEIRNYQKTIRRAIGIEFGACCVVAPGLLWFFSWAATGVERIALVISVASVVFVGVFIYRYCRVGAIPIDMGFEQAVAAYRSDLEYRCRLSATYFWWYLLPLSLGPTMLTIATELRIAAPFPIMAVLIAGTLLFMGVFSALLVWVQRRLIRKTRERINQLSIVTEKI